MNGQSGKNLSRTFENIRHLLGFLEALRTPRSLG
jgi:hypothetical protein